MTSPIPTNSSAFPINRKGQLKQSGCDPTAPSQDGLFPDRDALLDLFFDHAGTGLAVIFSDGRLAKVNPALCTMLGYPENDLQTIGLDSLLAPDQWCRLETLFDAILAGEPDPGQITIECQHRSGSTIHGLINLSAISDKSGNARYFILQIQDISSLICTKTELEESRQRYRALSDATFEAVFISVKGVCIDANRTASIMFDTPREKLIGIFGTDVIAPEYQSRVRENMLAGYETP